jgi:predicted DNA-binding antitoxin AbrB/MazE fold protein
LLLNVLVAGETAMTITIEAIYENGVLRPTRPLPLEEQETVWITIEPEPSWAERTAGLLPWTGDPELLQRIAETVAAVQAAKPESSTARISPRRQLRASGTGS